MPRGSGGSRDCRPRPLDSPVGKLGQDHEARLFAALCELARDPKWEVRKAVTMALAEYQGSEPRVDPVLEELARDANRWVSQAAGRALRRLRERSGSRHPLDAGRGSPGSDAQAHREADHEIGLRSVTPALIYDLAMEISDQSYRELAADTAHEIRTLLDAVRGLSRGVATPPGRPGQADDRTEHYLTAALTRLQQIQAFTEDLRTYSSVAETGFATVSVGELVQDAVDIGFDHLADRSELPDIVREIEVRPGSWSRPCGSA